MNARTLALVTVAVSAFGIGCSGEPEGSDEVTIELDKDGNLKDENGTTYKACMLKSVNTQCFSW